PSRLPDHPRGRRGVLVRSRSPRRYPQELRHEVRLGGLERAHRQAPRVSGARLYWLLAASVGAAFALVPEFRSAENLANVVTQAAPRGVLGVGQTFVVLCGLIDLSVGQLAGLVVVLVCALAGGRDAMTLPVVLVALAVGAAVGAVNGVLAPRLRIHTLILT